MATPQSMFANVISISLLPVGLSHYTLQRPNFGFTTLNAMKTDNKEMFKNLKKEISNKPQELLEDYSKLNNSLSSRRAGGCLSTDQTPPRRENVY